MRPDSRSEDDLRDVSMETEYVIYPEGSVLISTGRTKVLCNASIDESQPNHLYNTSKGWVTAEYNMLPRSAPHRQVREVVHGSRGGRTHEIQRLIGRTLRAVVDLNELGERTIWIDCDVIQADGGTRTASITGGYTAMVIAIQHLLNGDRIDRNPVQDRMAAVSVGKVDGEILLDLNYEEDNRADVDMNVAMTESGEFVEIQASGEEAVFTTDEFDLMAERARKGINELIELQSDILSE
ncbi:MAG: ribonuclease PH [bacterium]